MKRSILAILTTCTLASTGALMAQSTINTTAPGPTTQQEPGQTNNNLPNPGNPQTQLDRGTTSSAPTDTYGTTGQSTTTTGTQTGQTGTSTSTTGTTGTMNNQGTSGTMGTMGTATGTTTTTTTTETDTDVDVENDMNTTSRSTGAMTTDTSSSMDQSTSGGSYSGSDTDSLPSTGSEQPLLALLGLLAIGAALAIRQVR
jgi:LPXTG-motif cell wall-anchored protein